MSIESTSSAINPFESYEDERASYLMRRLIEVEQAIDAAQTDMERHELCAEIDELFAAERDELYSISGRIRIESEPENGASLIARLGRSSTDKKGRYFDVHNEPMVVYGAIIDQNTSAEPPKLALLLTDPHDPYGSQEVKESIYFTRVEELYRVAPIALTPEIARHKLETAFPEILQYIDQMPPREASKQLILEALKKLRVHPSAEQLKEHQLASYVEMVLNDRYRFRETAVRMIIGGMALTHAEDGTIMKFNIRDQEVKRSYLGPIVVNEVKNEQGEHRLLFLLTTYIPYGNQLGDYSGVMLPVSSVSDLYDAKLIRSFVPEGAAVFSQFDDYAPESIPRSVGSQSEVLAQMYGQELEGVSPHIELRRALEACDQELKATLRALAELPKPSSQDEEERERELDEYRRGVGEIWSYFMVRYRPVLEQFTLEVTGPGVVLPDVTVEEVEDDDSDDDVLMIRRSGSGTTRDMFNSFKGSFHGISTTQIEQDDETFSYGILMALMGNSEDYTFRDASGKALKYVTATGVLYAELDRGEVVVTIPELEKMRTMERAHASARKRLAEHPIMLQYIDDLYASVEHEDPGDFNPMDTKSIVDLFKYAAQDPNLTMTVMDIVEDILGPNRPLKLRGDIVFQNEDETIRASTEQLGGYGVMIFRYISPTHPSMSTGPVLVCEMLDEEVYVVIDTIKEIHI